MQKTFEGTLEELKAVVAASGISGHWLDEGAFHEFHSDEGPALNFWPDKKILMLQGSPAAKRRFEELFDAHIDKSE